MGSRRGRRPGRVRKTRDQAEHRGPVASVLAQGVPEFLDEYRRGRTPNPDILCNQEIKFRAFLDHATSLDATAIATGHYAAIRRGNGAYRLHKGADRNKDQSYFLCRLNQAQLAKSLFPLGALKKPEVRALAKRHGFITHDKKDSTGICFIGERPFRDFLSHYLPVQAGPIRTLDGADVGEHTGIHFYTLGQRQGLGIGGVKGYPEQPWYVVAKDMENNILTVAQGHDHPNPVQPRPHRLKPALDSGRPGPPPAMLRQNPLPPGRPTLYNRSCR